MSIARKAIISTFWTSGLNYIAMAIGFGIGIFRDRLLMPNENGIYMFSLAVVDLIFNFAALSFNVLVIQAQDEKEDIYSTALWCTIFLSVFLVLASLGVGWGMSIRGTLEIKIEAFFVLVGFSILNLFATLFQANLEKELEYQKIAKINLLSMLAFPVVSFLLIVNGYGAWGMVLGYCSSYFVSFVGMVLFSHYPIGFVFNSNTAKWLFSKGSRFIMSRGLEVIFIRYGTFVTEKLLGTSMQGSFGRALKYWEMAPQTVAPAVVTVAFPTYSKLQHDPEKLSQAVSMVLFFLVRALLPFVLVFSVLPVSFLNIIGKQWFDAVPVLRILAVGALLSPMFENMKQLLYAKGKPESIVKVRIIQVIVFIPTMYFLVLQFGIKGAAIAIVINFALGVASVLMIVRREISARWVRGLVLPIAFAIFAAIPVLLFPLRDFGIGAFLQFLLEAFYLIGIFLFLEVVFEYRHIREYARFIRSILKTSPSDPAP